MSICLTSDILGSGGVAGGAGTSGSVAYYNGAHSTSNGVPIIKVTAGIPSELGITVTNDIFGGTPIEVPDNHSVIVRVKPSIDSSDILMDKEVPHDGSSITVPIDKGELSKPGVYPMSVIFKDEDGVPYSEHLGYMCVEAGINDWSDVSSEPLTIADVRLALLDYSPEANVLLEDLELSDMQIVAAMKRPIREWNETPPDICTYNMTNFPYHEAWLKGTCSYLLEMAAHKYNRNTLPHNAAGLSMDPNNKGALYMSTAMALRQEWKAWIMAKKTEINMLNCWGSTSLNVYGDTYDSWLL